MKTSAARKVKICGMKHPENIRDIAALAPDLMGFIFYPGSKRYVGDGFSRDRISRLPAHIRSVGVFVNEVPENILARQKQFGFDFIQLHGHESPACCRELHAKGVGIIKAFGINEAFDFSELKAYGGYCDYFLFDTQTAAFGGSGKTFHWDLLRNYTLETPFFLSGGLGADNIDDALRWQHPHLAGFDLNSGLERSPAVKIKETSKVIIRKIQRYDH